MNKLYVVLQIIPDCGEYSEDQKGNLLFSSTDKQKVIAFIKNREEKRTKRNRLIEQIQNFLNKWANENPCKTERCWSTIHNRYPKTDIEKQEAYIILNKNGLVIKDWHDKQYVALTDYIKNNNLPDDLLRGKLNACGIVENINKDKYEIEEVPFEQ